MPKDITYNGVTHRVSIAHLTIDLEHDLIEIALARTNKQTYQAERTMHLYATGDSFLQFAGFRNTGTTLYESVRTAVWVYLEALRKPEVTLGRDAEPVDGWPDVSGILWVDAASTRPAPVPGEFSAPAELTEEPIDAGI